MHKLQNFFLQKKTQRFVFIVNEQASACLWEFISIWIQLEMNTFLSTIFSKTIFWNDLKRNVMVKQITYYGWITVFKVIFWKANFPIARVESSRADGPRCLFPAPATVSWHPAASFLTCKMNEYNAYICHNHTWRACCLGKKEFRSICQLAATDELLQSIKWFQLAKNC